MRIWFNNRIFESIDQNLNSDPVDTGDESFEPVEELDSESTDMEYVATRKLDPTIAIKRYNLKDKLYTNIIEFIKYNIGDTDELDVIRSYQSRIDDLFHELAEDVSSEYNSMKGKNKENSKVRDDSMKRKVLVMYRFFAYYIIKYDKSIVEWMESLVRAGLFNDKSQIKRIDGAYNNIDISNMFQLTQDQYNSENFNILDNNGAFNNTLTDFFNDSGTLVDDIGGKSGVFTHGLSQLITFFKNGISEDIRKPGEDKSSRIEVPVGYSEAISGVIESMTAIDAMINKIIKVDSIRTKFINDYQMNLQKMNLTQEQIKQQVNTMKEGIKNGEINTVEDFNKLQLKHKQYSTSDKQKEELGNKAARMAKAYKYKIEAVLNNQRGHTNV